MHALQLGVVLRPRLHRVRRQLAPVAQIQGADGLDLQVLREFGLHVRAGAVPERRSGQQQRHRPPRHPLAEAFKAGGGDRRAGPLLVGELEDPARAGDRVDRDQQQVVVGQLLRQAQHPRLRRQRGALGRAGAAGGRVQQPFQRDLGLLLRRGRQLVQVSGHVGRGFGAERRLREQHQQPSGDRVVVAAAQERQRAPVLVTQVKARQGPLAQQRQRHVADGPPADLIRVQQRLVQGGDGEVDADVPADRVLVDEHDLLHAPVHPLAGGQQQHERADRDPVTHLRVPVGGPASDQRRPLIGVEDGGHGAKLGRGRTRTARLLLRGW